MVLHVPPQAAAHLEGYDLVRAIGGGWMVALGDPAVISALGVCVTL